jgi:hypothetical protein
MEQKSRETAGRIDPIAPPEWLTNEAAARIRDGSLPQAVPPSIFAGPGRRQGCALCDHAIEPGELTYQVASGEPGGAPLHFHIPCFRAWESAARSTSQGAPGWASGVSVQRPMEPVE